MFIEPTITWVSSGFSEYIWLDTKIVFTKKLIKLSRTFHSLEECDPNCFGNSRCGSMGRVGSHKQSKFKILSHNCSIRH